MSNYFDHLYITVAAAFDTDDFMCDPCVICQVHYVTLSKLLDACTPSQLTFDFGGTLPYDHELWLQNRLVAAFLSVLNSVCNCLQ